MATLFSNGSICVYSFKSQYSVETSTEFFDCADRQLTKTFVRLTSIRPSNNVSIAFVRKEDFYYHKDTVSKLPFLIWVRTGAPQVTVCWKSKSGRIYDINDSDIDCNDIEFWFEDFDAQAIIKYASPNNPLPFKLDNLSYTLEVEFIAIDCNIEMKLKDSTREAGEIIKVIDDFINDFNIKSEKKDREYGVVHNFKSDYDNGEIIYQLDLGSTGPLFLKKLLTFLSKMAVFDRVKIY